MTRILVVWEDDFWEPLGGMMKRLVRSLAPVPDAQAPTVLFHTTRSNSAFERYARTTWPAVRSRGLPTDPGLIDHLLCIVDGDRLHDLLPTLIPHPPGEVDAVSMWHAAAERAWQERLRATCDPGGPPVTTVHGAVLRWNKESLLLAGYDQPTMEVHLDLSAEHPAVAASLADCTPRPQDVEDQRFTDTFRRPSGCLERLRKARGLGALHKNAPEIDDALRMLSRESLPKIRVRVPDIGRIALRIWALHQREPEPGKPQPAPLAAAVGRKARKKATKPSP